MNCSICNSESEIITSLHDDRYGYSGTYPLRACLICGHAFLDAHFSQADLNTLYSTYYPRSAFSLESYQPHYEASGFSAWLNGVSASAFRWVPKNVRVLDIGCGFGETLGYHQARGCDVYGVEADQNIKRVAEKFGYKVHVGLFDPKRYESAFFDYVTMDQVLEHVQNPISVLQGVAQVLKPDGHLIVSVPNAKGWGAWLFGRYWINWHAPYHLQFFSESSMQIAAEKSGFRIERSFTITSSSWLHYQWVHLLTYPDEGVPSKFWAQKGTYSFSQKVGVKFLSVAHRLKINHVLTRIFDALDLGDSRLYILRKI
ncbi:MAG: class I SAM-dependent methyltransferase [Methylomonas sp.]|uniref:class I SAM-dependent methyltransferase n=1 Tax=Methylomonas sp. TaxID=418 RepID=UPI0025D7EDA1|nr:class I SAM-dependent methyltransferase [Methylomonas sp.]MCK9607887.1 class I SAM-dependent methyltransferase [Methylomonas sp.]